MTTIKIAHISDPHFGTTTKEKISALQSSLREFAPDLIVFSGDITQRATHEQFLAARDFCNELREFSILATPGNHDISLLNIPKRLFQPYDGFTKTFGFTLVERWQKSEIEVVALNSTSRFRHTQGSFTPYELGKLESYKPDSKFRMAVFHHPMDCAKRADDKNVMKHGEVVMDALQKGDVDLVVGGHVHDPYVTLSTRRYPDIKRPCIISVAGTCLSSRTRSGAPNSYTQYEITNASALKAKRIDLAVSGHFMPVLETSFARSSSGLWKSAD